MILRVIIFVSSFVFHLNAFACDSTFLAKINSGFQPQFDDFSDALNVDKHRRIYVNERGDKVELWSIVGEDPAMIKKQLRQLLKKKDNPSSSIREHFARSLTGTWVAACTATTCFVEFAKGFYLVWDNELVDVSGSSSPLQVASFLAPKLLMVGVGFVFTVTPFRLNNYVQTILMHENTLDSLDFFVEARREMPAGGTDLVVIFESERGYRLQKQIADLLVQHNYRRHN